MKYDPWRHDRRSIRLPEYDYATAGMYFVTICTQDRAGLFGNVMNGKIVMNAFGAIVCQNP